MTNKEYIEQRIEQIQTFLLNHDPGKTAISGEGFSIQWNLDTLKSELKELEAKLAVINGARGWKEANLNNSF
jgi:hypothetical protein